MRYLIANWKAEMNLEQAIEWCEEWKIIFNQNKTVSTLVASNKLTLVVCPSFSHIGFMTALREYGIHLGAQDISRHCAGKFTGEVTQEQLKGCVEYMIVGHSERRSHEKESENLIEEKIHRACEVGINPVLCVRSVNDTIYNASSTIAYEPVEAIGSGQNADPKDVQKLKHALYLPQDVAFLYGGSVDVGNAASYIQTGEIDGFLVGGASLKATHFYDLACACGV